MAFAPAENPQVIGLVLIDEPKGTYYGGTVAGPVMKEIMCNTLPYLGIEPVYTEKEKELEEVQTIIVPDFNTLSIKEAKNLAHENGVTVEIKGEGNSVVRQFPIAKEIINKNSKIILYTE